MNAPGMIRYLLQRVVALARGLGLQRQASEVVDAKRAPGCAPDGLVVLDGKTYFEEKERERAAKRAVAAAESAERARLRAAFEAAPADVRERITVQAENELAVLRQRPRAFAAGVGHREIELFEQYLREEQEEDPSERWRVRKG